MKRMGLLIVLIFAATCSAVDVGGIEQGTIYLLRATANEDPNTAINSTTIDDINAGDWDHMPTDANGLKKVENEGTKRTNKKYIGVMACARGAASKTFTVDYWLWLSDKGPALKAMSVVYTTGTRKVVKYLHSPYTAVADAYWAGSGTVTKGLPLTTGENTDGSDNIKLIVIDSMGAYAIYAEVLNADGSTGTEAGDVTVYWFTMSG